MSFNSRIIDQQIFLDIDPEVAEIKAKTDNLPVDPADASDITAAFGVTDGKVDAVKTVVDAVLVDTAEIGVAGAGLTALPAPVDMALDSTVAKEASLAALATSAEISALDTVVDSGFTAGAKSSEVSALDTVVDGLITTVGVAGAGLTALPALVDMALDSTVAKEASLAGLSTSAEIVALDSVVDAGFVAGAKEASLAALALEASVQSVLGKVDGVPNIGTFSYLDAGGEQTIVEVTPGAGEVWELGDFQLDMFNMTQNGTIKCYSKVDGTTYREFSSDSFVVATDSKGGFLPLPRMINKALKVTWTEGADETAARDMPFQLNYVIR